MPHSIKGILVPALVITVISTAATAQKKVTVTAIKPTKGIPGSEITITGSNFAAELSDNRVFLNKTQMKLTNVFPNTITAIIPKKAKSGAIKVQTRKNGSATAPNKFTVITPLTIKGISAKKTTVGGQLVIRGSGFDPKPKNNKVRLGKLKCKVVRVSRNEMAFEVPNKAVKGKLSIEVPDQPAVTSPGDIAVYEKPKITKFTPTSGRSGQEISIRGDNFGNSVGSVEVRIGAVPVQVVSVKSKEIKAKITSNARSGAVQLAVNGIKSDPSNKSFTVQAPLKATKMDPLSVSPGGEVRIYGTGFATKAKDHTLHIGNKSVRATTVASDHVAFTIPNKIAGGKHSVTLDVKKLGTISIPVPLNIIQQVDISSFTPTSGPPGSSVTIYGNNFGNNSKDVRVFIGRQAAPVRSVSSDSISISVPNNASSSRITVQTRYNGTAVTSETFSVGIPLSVSSFSPSGGSPNQQVRIYGQGFSSTPAQNKVFLGKTPVKVLQAAPNNLLVQIPQKARSNRFTVTVGKKSGQTPGTFQVLEAAKAQSIAGLTIMSITPTSGTGGSVIQIKGTGFENGIRAWIGRTAAGIKVYSPTQAIIGVPHNAAGGAITLMLPSGVRTMSKETFKIAAEVTVNKFYPTSGRPGAQVTLYGTEFAPGRTQVYLGNTALPVKPGGNATMLQVTIPETAQSGPFRVAVAGKKEIRSVSAFKVLPPIQQFQPKEEPKAESVLASKPDDTPVIEKLMKEEPKEALPAKKETPEKAPTMDELLGFESDGEKLEFKSFEPTSGAVGDTITLNGSGFGDDPKKVQAWINDQQAMVVGCVPDMIMIEVPQKAASGRIKIRIGGKPPLTSKKNIDIKK